MSRIEIKNINFEDADIKEDSVIETYVKVNDLYATQISPKNISFSMSQEDALNICEYEDNSGDLDVWHIDTLIKAIEPTNIFIKDLKFEQVIKTKVTIEVEKKNDITDVVLKLATAIK